MATQQLLIRIPEELAQRLRRRIPARGRSAFVQRLLEEALPADDGEKDPLYLAALAVEQDQRLGTEMTDWDAAIGDGLAPGVARTPAA